MSGTPASATVVAQLVETMRALAGPHPGFRPVHAKGIVCSGTFRASAGARAVSRALHLQGQAVPTVVRFSNSSGSRRTRWYPQRPRAGGEISVTRWQERRHPGAPHRRVSRADT
jgi:catalase